MANEQPSEIVATIKLPDSSNMPAYKRAWRARRRVMGVCTTCGGNRDVPKRVRCSICLAADRSLYAGKSRAYKRRQIESIYAKIRMWRRKKRCVICGANRDTAGRLRCNRCLAKNRAALKKQADKRRGAGLCPKCGRERDGGIVCNRCRARGQQEYRKAFALNPSAARIKCQRRRCRKLANGGELTSEQWSAIKEKYKHRCLKCKKREPEISLTIDHVIPVFHSGANDISNVQPLCESCNKSKGARTIDYRVRTPSGPRKPQE